MNTVAGLDVGATTVRAALADHRGKLYATATEPTPRDRDDAVDAIQTVLETAASEASIPLGSVSAVGIGAMGPLDHDDGRIVDPPNVPEVDEIPVAAAVETVHAGDVVLTNDATAAAIGERYYSDGSVENLVYLTISSGIGAGALVDGHVLHGSSGNAAEMGHVTVAPESDRQCGCGGTGHWEALCSGQAIPETTRRIAADTTVETDLDLTGLTAAAVFDAVGADPLANLVVERLATWNTLGTAALVHAYDPGTIHIGGAVATNNPDEVVDPIRQRLPARVVGETPTVAATPLGTNAVLRGAVATAIRYVAGTRR